MALMGGVQIEEHERLHRWLSRQTSHSICYLLRWQLNLEDVAMQYKFDHFYWVCWWGSKINQKQRILQGQNIILLIDNVSYHKTKSVVVKLSWFYHLVLFILPYSPQFNPIELFYEALKAKIRRLRVEGTRKLSAEDEIQRIIDIINQINPSVILKIKIAYL